MTGWVKCCSVSVVTVSFSLGISHLLCLFVGVFFPVFLLSVCMALIVSLSLSVSVSAVVFFCFSVSVSALSLSVSLVCVSVSLCLFTWHRDRDTSLFCSPPEEKFLIILVPQSTSFPLAVSSLQFRLLNIFLGWIRNFKGE